MHSTNRDARAGGGGSVELGLVLRPHGVRGHVRVRLHNPQSTALDQPQEVSLRLPGGALRQARMRAVGGRGQLRVVAITGIASPEQAEELRGASIELARTQFEALEAGEYYYADLIGCRVIDGTGQEAGVVVQVFEAGASDVLVIHEGSLERYVPFVEPWIKKVDLERRTIEVNQIEEWASWPAT